MTNNTSIRLPSSAKINLFLHVLGRRADGYHNLQTAFQFLDYGDQMAFEIDPTGAINLTNNIPGVPQEQNLIYRAAQALKKFSRCELGARISLEKNIPVGGGLGGGSSNAATTLLALNHLWQTACSNEQLQQLGKSLGADVPIFVFGKSAWAEGIGEQFSAIKLTEPWYLVLTPKCQVNTAAIFNNKNLTTNTPPIKIAAFLAQGGKNDLQEIVCSLYPEVHRALNLLSKFGNARITGSGACVFCEFQNQQQAQAALNKISHQCDGFIAQGQNISPTHRALELLPRDGN